MPFNCIELPIRRASEVLIVDETSRTGLRWRVTTGPRALAGYEAGSIDNYGYFIVKLDGVKYRNHRLIWAMINGQVPDGMTIDHIDRNKVNNRIVNLRIATNKMQAKNKNAYVRTGMLGKSAGSIYTRSSGRMDASIVINKKGFYKSGRDRAELERWIDEVKASEFARLGLI